MKRIGRTIINLNTDIIVPKKVNIERVKQWNAVFRDHIKVGLEVREAQQKINERLGYPLLWSPGQGEPS